MHSTDIESSPPGEPAPSSAETFATEELKTAREENLRLLAEMENQQRISPTANMWMGLSDRSSRWRAPSTLAGERCWKRGKLRSGGRCRRGTKSQTYSSKQIAVVRTRTV